MTPLQNVHAWAEELRHPKVLSEVPEVLRREMLPLGEDRFGCVLPAKEPNGGRDGNAV